MNAITASAFGLRNRWSQVTDRLAAWISDTIVSLGARLALAAIFFMSGRTKVEGFLTLTDGAYALFRDEYKLPLVPPEIAAHLAAYSEHFFPLLLVLGLFTRFAALALLGMTIVIEVFVYPDAWPTHLSWAVLALYLIGRGGGRASVDHVIGVR